MRSQARGRDKSHHSDHDKDAKSGRGQRSGRVGKKEGEGKKRPRTGEKHLHSHYIYFRAKKKARSTKRVEKKEWFRQGEMSIRKSEQERVQKKKSDT